MGTTSSQPDQEGAQSQQQRPTSYLHSISSNIVPHSLNTDVNNNNNNNNNGSGAYNKPINEANKVPKNNNNNNTNNNQNNIPNNNKKEANKVSSLINNNTYIKPREANEMLPKLPHNYAAIIKDIVGHVDNSSVEKLYQQLYAGVYLSGKTQKYWVDKDEKCNCFAVFANGLTITWGNNPQYWNLHFEKTRDQVNILVAQLLNVCWLEIHGRFHTANLSPGVTYQVSYLIKLEPESYGWEVPVNLRLIHPNGTKQEHKENLSEKPKGEWVQIRVGEFKTYPEMLGEIAFSLYEYEGGNWKKGLVVKCATIEPKLEFTVY